MQYVPQMRRMWYNDGNEQATVAAGLLLNKTNSQPDNQALVGFGDGYPLPGMSGWAVI